MTKPRLVALAGLVLLLALPAVRPALAADDGLTGGQWVEIGTFIEQTLGSKPSGSDSSISLGPGTTATVTPERAVSAATGRLCDRCSDPCRDFALRLSTGDGASIFEYSGRRCTDSSDFSSWREAGPLALLRVLRAGPDPERLRRAGAFLAALSYLGPGEGADAGRVMAALEVFRGDAELSTRGESDVAEADIAALRETANRSNRRTPCAAARAAGAGPFAACEAPPF